MSDHHTAAVVAIADARTEPTHAAIITRITVAEVKIDDIKDDVSETKTRVAGIETELRAIRELLAGARGGWRVLVVVGAVISAVLTIVGWVAPALVRKLIG